MYVVRGPADLQRLATKASNDAAEVRVNPLVEILAHGRYTILRAEDQVVVKAHMGRWHRSSSTAPSGAESWGRRFRGLRFACHRLPSDPASGAYAEASFPHG